MSNLEDNEDSVDEQGSVNSKDKWSQAAKDGISTGVPIGLSFAFGPPGAIVGTFISRIINHIPSRLEKRRNKFLSETSERLAILEQRNSIDPPQLENDEVFLSQVFQATQIAIAHHEQERLEALKNTVVNTAIDPTNPDDSRRKLFTQWLSELTPWHWKILMIFELRDLPPIDPSSQRWFIESNARKMGKIIIHHYPELDKNYDLILRIISDLYSRGLISNYFPSANMMSRVEQSPQITQLGGQFLKFIQEPEVLNNE